MLHVGEYSGLSYSFTEISQMYGQISGTLQEMRLQLDARPRNVKLTIEYRDVSNALYNINKDWNRYLSGRIEFTWQGDTTSTDIPAPELDRFKARLAALTPAYSAVLAMSETVAPSSSTKPLIIWGGGLVGALVLWKIFK